MRLVFVHGWAFDHAFWRALRAQLDGFESIDVELGFLGAERSIPDFHPDDVLIGHSLGFMWGVASYENWCSRISINGFARFVPACVPEAALRAMRRNLMRNDAQTVADFCKTIGYAPAPTRVNKSALAEGLDWLQNMDVTPRLSAANSKLLVLAAENDPLVPESASQNLAEGANHSTLVWHKTAGHLLPLNDPAWCAQQLREFLA
jgi:pimeloyl-[acyl-carrier protein] methyl ester esterase